MVRNVAILCLLPGAPFRGPFPLYTQEVCHAFHRSYDERCHRAHVGVSRVFAVVGIAGLAVGHSALAGHPDPVRSRAALTDVLPSVGSAAGGTSLKIVGTGFRPGMVAMFDDIKGTGRFDSWDTSFTTFFTETPAHAVGTVDLVVSNPDGQSHRVEAGYTYASPDSFDPNGVWSGYTLHGSDTWVEFVIRGNRLVSASCTYDTKIPFTFAELPNVHDGQFSVVADGGATISGRIVSASEMAGRSAFRHAPPRP